MKRRPHPATAATVNKPDAPLTAMVREAIAAGKTDLAEIISWVQAKHGIVLQRSFVHVLKSQIEAAK